MNDAGNNGHSSDPTENFGPDRRDPLDHLAEEFAERCRRGEAPSIAEYEARFPDQAERVRKLLGAVGMMEQLRRGSRQARVMPERLGEFRILRELGRGGMGVVYEAVQESLDRHVAVKAMHHVHLDPKRLRRFQREAQAVAQLHHTNIVPIFGVGEHEGLPYYVMQVIRGNGLDVLLGRWRTGGSPKDADRWRFAARVGMQAAEALQYAHEQGVLHRDVKPANLLLDEHEAVWITDFGLAKLTGREELTGSGDVIGTLRYLAPEALHGEADARGDVYSLGLTLYELLTLEPPFGELGPSELLRRVSEGHPVTPRRLVPSIPADLETIVLKSIAREPDHRYQTAGALADDLRRFLEDRPILARRATPVERAWRWSRRNRMTAALMATAALSLATAAAVGWIGYAVTTKALAGESAKRTEAEEATGRAEANVALSLEIFGELFESLASADTLPSPPLGMLMSRMARGPDGGPHGRDDGPRGPGPGRGPKGGLLPGMGGPGEHLARKPFGPGDPPPGEGLGPMGEPRMGPRFASFEGDTRLLQSVLTFFDRFAAQNAQNAKDPRLMGEAARAYRKVARLYQGLGRDDEAEQALARAIAMFEELVGRFPEAPLYRSQLVETYLLADPWTADPATLERVESRLRRARSLADGLASVAPDDPDYAQARVVVRAKLGAALQGLNHSDEAEACYREAIDLAGALVEGSEKGMRGRLDLVASREALAVLLVARGRRDEALVQLAAIVPDLRSLAAQRGMSRPVADRAEAVAAIYETLGQAALSKEMSDLAAELDARPRGGPGQGPGHRDRMRFPPQPGENP